MKLLRHPQLLTVALLMLPVAVLAPPSTSAAVDRTVTGPAAVSRTNIPPVNDPATMPKVGVQFHGTWSNYTDAQRRQLLDQIAASGVQWVRIGVSWAMIQPRRPSETDAGWNWSWGIPRVDSVIDMARARGLRVRATFGRTPAWANDGAGEAAAPASLADWRRAAAFVAQRYAGKVSSWEIWNEPNHPKYFLNGTPTAYTALLCSAYPVIKSAAPKTKVVYGGTSGNDWQFIKATYEAGVKGCFDVLAVHPYQDAQWEPEMIATRTDRWYFSNVSLVRQVQLQYRDRKPIWFTEVGWSTHANAPGTPSWAVGLTEEQQADYLLRMLANTADNYPYVKKVSIYSSRDETDFDLHNNNFGLWRSDLSPKPSALALDAFMERYS